MAKAKSILEAILFASAQPLTQEALTALLPSGSDVPSLLAEISRDYEGRGVHVVRTRRGFAVRTRQEASDLATLAASAPARLTRAALETLSAIAIYDAMGTPLTRSEIERVRGVSLSPGITDTLLSMGYVKLGRRRDTPGRPLTWVVTDAFHDAFGLQGLDDLSAFQAMREDGLAVLRPLERSSPEESTEDDQASVL